MGTCNGGCENFLALVQVLESLKYKSTATYKLAATLACFAKTYYETLGNPYVFSRTPFVWGVGLFWIISFDFGVTCYYEFNYNSFSQAYVHYNIFL